MFARSFRLVSLLFFFVGALLVTSCGKIHNGSYNVGIDPLWYPLNFTQKENNVMGFSSELLADVARKESFSVSLLSTNWNTLLEGLLEGSYEAVLSSLYPYNFNKSTYDFSDVYLPIGPVLLLPTSSKYSSLEEIKQREVGAVTGSASVLILEKYPEILIKTYDTAAALIADLLAGDIAGGLLPILTAETFTQGSFTEELKIASKPLNEEGLRLVALKGKQEKLLSHFNEGLKKLKKNDSYEKLLAKWQLIQMSDDL